MYKQENYFQTEMDFGEFFLPFGGKLDKENRWIKLSSQIPWNEFESMYAEQFGSTGNAAKSLRMALGSLIIKERLGLTDRETVEQIRENPYLQYFIGLTAYQSESPFDASSMVYFRKRFDAAFIGKLNERICREEGIDKAEQESEEPSGKPIIDATCAPEDLRHPTDLTLLSDARETTEAVIDELWKCNGPKEKPRTYRQNARKDYLKVIKSKKPSLHRCCVRESSISWGIWEEISGRSARWLRQTTH
jgi:transposase, IS5 family